MMALRLRQPEQTRPGIARLRPRRDAAELDEAEAECGERVDVLGVLVEARREAHRVGEVEAHDAHRGARDPCLEKNEASSASRRVDLMRGFGVERKEQGPSQGVQHP